MPRMDPYAQSPWPARQDKAAPNDYTNQRRSERAPIVTREEQSMYAARIATTANQGLSGLSAIDGITPAEGDLILVWKQSTASQNGLYRATTGTWQKQLSFTNQNLYKVVSVALGTLYGKTLFICTASNTIAGMGAYYL